jgi:hypothetical protein
MKFKKIFEAYFYYDGEDIGNLTLPYPDSQVGASTYSGFITLYDKADPVTRIKIGDIRWAKNYTVKTNITDHKTRDCEPETVRIVLKDGIIQFSFFVSNNVRSEGFLQNTLPFYFTILGGTEKYLGIRGYVKLQKLSLENQDTILEVYSRT